jgi:predicted dehydrogenase
MGDLLRYASEHPRAEIVGVSDEQPGRMEEAVRKLRLPREKAFTDYKACLEQSSPDIVILCPAASKHGEWVKKVAPYGAHIMVEKPFAASLKEADAMIAAMATDQTLMINWPLQWVASHRKAYELVTQGLIGEVTNVWHFGGNRGPLWHGADKDEKTPAQVAREKPRSWFYKKAHGGGSLLDYLRATRTGSQNSKRVGEHLRIPGPYNPSLNAVLSLRARKAPSAPTITMTMSPCRRARRLCRIASRLRPPSHLIKIRCSI